MSAPIMHQMFPFQTLPPELQSLILQHAIQSLDIPCINVLLISRSFFQISLPYLYRRITLTSRFSLSAFLRTLKVHPEYSSYIRTLEVYSARLNWNEAVMLARIIDRYHQQQQQPQQASATLGPTWPISSSSKVARLRVRFPATDIPQAIDFFQHFSPTHFEWITQPCWLLRPGELLMRFMLSNWSNLETLHLGNFEYDTSFAKAICTLPKLTQLTLSGMSNTKLDAETIRIILTQGCTAKRLRWLYIADCPARRRNWLESELGTAVPTALPTSATAISDPQRAQADSALPSDPSPYLDSIRNVEMFANTAGCVKFCPRCRIQARERLMQRHTLEAWTPQQISSEPKSVHHVRTQDEKPAVAHTLDEKNDEPETHQGLLRRRILESMRWRLI